MISENFDLQRLNTFGIAAKAKKFTCFTSVEELQNILKNESEPIFILGGGSNMLLTKDIECLVLKNEILGIEIIAESDTEVQIRSGAGETWHDLVMFCVDKNFGGLENLSLIPGSVGASPMQNIGAYGVEIKDSFISLEAVKIKDQTVHHFDNASCEFGYRESIFKRKVKDQFVITSVVFKLTKANHKLKTSYGAINEELTKNNISNPTIKDVSNAVIAIRESKLPNPKVLGNAGSFFKNPVIEKIQFEALQAKFPEMPNYPSPNGVKLAAGWLIEQCGWKGKQIGNCGVHKLQALVLVNYGGSKGKEIFELSTQVIKSVLEKFGVTLEREVNIV